MVLVLILERNLFYAIHFELSFCTRDDCLRMLFVRKSRYIRRDQRFFLEILAPSLTLGICIR